MGIHQLGKQCEETLPVLKTVSDGLLKRLRCEVNIGIGKQQPLAAAGPDSLLQCMNLAELPFG